MSEEDKKLISKSDVGEKAEVVGALVNKLSGIIPAVARWKAEAEETTLHSMIKQDDIARRAGVRILRHQGNIEDIAHIAAESMPPDSAQKIRDLDTDWADDVAEKCKTVSNKEMQSLWAKILAGEAGKPGSFSKRTVALLGMMGKDDAEMFRDFCQFVWHDIAREIYPLIYNWDDEIYDVFGASGQSFGQAIPAKRHMLSVVEHLDALGLISFVVSEHRLILSSEPKILWFYQESSAIVIDVPPRQKGEHKGKYAMETGKVSFTKAGEQLYRVCGAQKNAPFFNYIFDKWEELGYNPSVVSIIKTK